MNRAAIMQPMDAAAAAGRFALQACAACGAIQYPPRELCQLCLSADLLWQVTESAEGAVLAATTLRHSHEPRTPLPLRIGLVQLDAGPVMVCFVPDAPPETRVSLTATVDGQGRAIITARSQR